MKEYRFRDVIEFQNEFRSREAKEEALSQLDDREIWHLAMTCSNITGAAWYKSHLKDPNYRGDEEDVT